MNHIKWLLVSDVHFPRHCPRKVELFLKVAKAWKPDAIDLLGDIDDADSTSRWVEGTPRAIELVDPGVLATREFMYELTQITKSEDNHFHDGNHGWYRHKKYLEKNAAPFLGLINAETLYQPSNYGFEFHDYDDKPIRRFGNMFAHHGESISKHSGESVRNDVQKELVSLVRGHCFSEDTEILTPTGWKNYKDISVGSQVMTLNRDSSELEWNAVNEKFVYSVYKDLISVKSHGLDLMVTPGHGLWVAPKNGKFKVETAEESFGKRRQFISVTDGAQLSDLKIIIDRNNFVGKSDWATIPYNGNVWCVNVNNSTLVVRRNRKTAITMNSHRQGSYFSNHELASLALEGYEIGHLCDEDQMKYEATKNWQAGFAIAHVENDIPFVQLIQVKMTDLGYTCYIDGKRFIA